jgi:hypothetical protein
MLLRDKVSNLGRPKVTCPLNLLAISLVELSYYYPLLLTLLGIHTTKRHMRANGVIPSGHRWIATLDSGSELMSQRYLACHDFSMLDGISIFIGNIVTMWFLYVIYCDL